MKFMSLTKRQKELVTLISNFMIQHKYAPTNRELCKLAGLNSPATIHGRLAALRRKGIVEWEESKPRTLKLLVEVNHEGDIKSLLTVGSKG